MSFCRKCGGVIPPDAGFCPRCGAVAADGGGVPPRRGRGGGLWRRVAARLQIPGTRAWLAVSVGGGLVLAAGILAAAFLEPTSVPWFPQCPLHRLTGLECPGCGTARAIHALAHGDWRAAFRFNAILFPALPFLGVLVAKPRLARRPAVAWGTLAVALGWMVVRNLIRLF